MYKYVVFKVHCISFNTVYPSFLTFFRTSFYLFWSYDLDIIRCITNGLINVIKSTAFKSSFKSQN